MFDEHKIKYDFEQIMNKGKVKVRILNGDEAEEWKQRGSFSSATIIDGEKVDGIIQVWELL